jgi:hypothetical protein
MRRCPHCHEPTLQTLRVIHSRRGRPLRCRACGQSSFLPLWARLPGVIVMECAMWAIVIAALWYQSVWIAAGIMLLPALVVWLTGALAPLTTVARD